MDMIVSEGTIAGHVFSTSARHDGFRRAFPCVANTHLTNADSMCFASVEIINSARGF